MKECIGHIFSGPCYRVQRELNKMRGINLGTFYCKPNAKQAGQREREKQTGSFRK